MARMAAVLVKECKIMKFPIQFTICQNATYLTSSGQAKEARYAQINITRVIYISNQWENTMFRGRLKKSCGLLDSLIDFNNKDHVQNVPS